MSKERRQLSEAFERTIRWYPPWNEREHMIIRCGGYPNVPLLGTQGTINYNLELVSQQVGFSMIRAPLEEVMIPFVLHGLEAHRGEYHRKIQHTWNNIIRKRVAWRTKICGISPSYRIWLENRVKLDQEIQGYEVQETLKIRELENTLEQMKAEQGALKRMLETASEEICLLRQLNDEIKKRA
ncbi:hypothetical protein CR513_57697, partial [Mucuna pruriens]